MIIRLCGLAMCLAMGVALLAACGEDPESATDQPDQPDPTVSEGADTPTISQPPSTPTTAPPESPPQTSGPAGPRIMAEDSEFGSMLFDGGGQAIYLFDVETAKPACYDACAEAWPPVLTEGNPVAGDGIRAALLGTTKRTDGTVQVTYNDHPLYYYAHEGRGEVKCHDVFLNGGNWYVVQPNGDAAPPG